MGLVYMIWDFHGLVGSEKDIQGFEKACRKADGNF